MVDRQDAEPEGNPEFRNRPLHVPLTLEQLAEGLLRTPPKKPADEPPAEKPQGKLKRSPKKK